MKTLFNIGDEVTFNVTGKIIEYSIGRNGDCYVIEIPVTRPSGRQEELRMYMSTEQFKNIEWEVKVLDAMVEEEETEN